MSIEVVEVVTAGPIGAAGSPFSFDYAQANNVDVSDITYTEVLSLTTESRVAGVYTITKSMLYTLDVAHRSAFFRFSIDNGITWTEIREEPKDNSDIIPISHVSIVDHPGGVFNILIESRKEDIGNVLTLHDISVSVEGKTT